MADRRISSTDKILKKNSCQWATIDDSSVSKTIERLYGLLNSSWDCDGQPSLLTGESL